MQIIFQKSMQFAICSWLSFIRNNYVFFFIQIDLPFYSVHKTLKILLLLLLTNEYFRNSLYNMSKYKKNKIYRNLLIFLLSIFLHVEQNKFFYK